MAFSGYLEVCRSHISGCVCAGVFREKPLKKERSTGLLNGIFQWAGAWMKYKEKGENHVDANIPCVLLPGPLKCAKAASLIHGHGQDPFLPLSLPHCDGLNLQTVSQSKSSLRPLLVKFLVSATRKVANIPHYPKKPHLAFIVRVCHIATEIHKAAAFFFF